MRSLITAGVAVALLGSAAATAAAEAQTPQKFDLACRTGSGVSIGPYIFDLTKKRGCFEDCQGGDAWFPVEVKQVTLTLKIDGATSIFDRTTGAFTLTAHPRGKPEVALAGTCQLAPYTGEDAPRRIF